MHKFKFYIPALPLLALCLYVITTGNLPSSQQWVCGIAWMVINLVQQSDKLTIDTSADATAKD